MSGSDALENIRRSTSVILYLTLMDKLLAVAKEKFFAYRFGISADLDVFNVAYALPATVAMVLSGVVVSVMVPLYAGWRETSPEASRRAGATVAWSCVVFFALLAAACFAASDQLFSWLGYAYPEGSSSMALGRELEALLVWLIFIEGAGAALAGWRLQSDKAFGALYAAQLCVNLCLILSLWLWPQTDVRALAAGFLIGVSAKFLVMVLSLPRSKRVLSPLNAQDPKALAAFALMAAPLAVNGLLVNANIAIDQVMSESLPAGSVSALRFAYRINDMPLTLLIAAMSAAVLPFISEQAASGDRDGMRRVFWRGVLFIVVVSLPVTGFVFLFSDQIVTLLLKGGAFDDRALEVTSLTLVCYSVGFLFTAYSFLNGVFFYALRRGKTLLAVAVFTLGMNVFFNWFYIRLFNGPEAIALSTATTMFLTMSIFLVIIERVLGVFASRPSLGPFLIVAGLCELGYGAAWLGKRLAAAMDLSLMWAFPVLAMLYGVVYLGGLMLTGREDIVWCLSVAAPFLGRRLKARHAHRT